MRFLLSVAVLALAACAGPVARVSETGVARAAVRDFSLDARFSVTQDAERHSGRLSWQHRSEGDELQLASPFGQVVAEISIDRRRARLVASDRRVYEAADGEQLTRAVLGYALPVDRLADWVLARGRDAGHARITADAAGRPQAMVEDGWQISYEYDHDDVDALPARLLATRSGGPELRLRIENWRTP